MSDLTTTQNKVTPLSDQLAHRIQAEIGQNVFLCYQCIKCSSGCPLSEFFDWQPNQIMRAMQFGDEEIAFQSETPWLCASCQTCSTRCPQGLDITAIMEFLTREALQRGYKPKVREVDHMNKAFMNEVKIWGRAYELGLMAEMKLRTMNLFDDLDLGAKMIAKRKISFLPHIAGSSKNVKPVPQEENRIAYYPGCSLHSIAPEFHTSTLAVTEALDLELVEPKGWVCCGSSAAHRSNPEEALRLPMENLRIIEQSGFEEVTMPCAACFNRHKAAQHEIRQHPDRRQSISDQINYQYQDSVQVNTLSESLLEHVGAENINDKVSNPLQGLKVVPYYGCLLTRPPEVTEVKNPENPTDLDEIITALGAEVVDWSYKTCCCGASHSLTRPDIVLSLSSSLIEKAIDAGADMIAVACPLCHANLDARQFQMDVSAPLPILYFTQLIALALGLPDKSVALKKNMIDPRPLLISKGLLS
ncbi:MAG: heterodisulfide reductase-related iron-sulfur binding cluster [Chloroflexota bacterium]